jgi:hypothetical protein
LGLKVLITLANGFLDFTGQHDGPYLDERGVYHTSRYEKYRQISARLQLLFRSKSQNSSELLLKWIFFIL